MNWSDISAGDLLLLDNYKMVLVLQTIPEDPFYDYGLDVFVSYIHNMKPFWTESKRLKPLSSDLLHYYTPTLSP